jgi:uncharacterized protein YdhG (YjbR/CyaY superfamily)
MPMPTQGTIVPGERAVQQEHRSVARSSTIAPSAPRDMAPAPRPAMSPVAERRLSRVATTFASVDDYIASFPPAARLVLEEVRRTMHATVAGAGEAIRYNIPTLTLGGRSVVHFAGWKRHVSIYPIPDGDAAYEAQVAPYRSGASTAKFPLTEPIPVELIARITTLLVAPDET